MPRKADARLEGRILDAAHRILSERGEESLTMRAVASACGTTTPTLYERFSNKEDLLSLLRRRARLNLFSAIKSSRSPEQVCRGVLDFRSEEHSLNSSHSQISYAVFCLKK